MKILERGKQAERGAIVLHVALILLALLALMSFAVDNGVAFASRRQAQNAADAAALAGVNSMAFGGADQALARNNAVAVAQANPIWNAPPDVTPADIDANAPCPPGTPPDGVPPCVRADVFRTNYERPGGNPLPTFFANIVGLSEQGVRASATAQMRAASSTTDCVKPWAIPDRWIENGAPPWDPAPADMTNPALFQAAGAGADTYLPPNAGSSGTGYSLPADYGRLVTLAPIVVGQPAAAPGYFPVVVDSGMSYLSAITTCTSQLIGPWPGAPPLNLESAAVTALTQSSIDLLVSRDAAALWDTSANGGAGGPTGGCMADGTCSRSPRIVALMVFDPAAYDAVRGLPNPQLAITNVVGLWLEGAPAGNITGRLMPYPTISLTGEPFGNPPASSSFARATILIR